MVVATSTPNQRPPPRLHEVRDLLCRSCEEHWFGFMLLLALGIAAAQTSGPLPDLRCELRTSDL